MGFFASLLMSVFGPNKVPETLHESVQTYIQERLMVDADKLMKIMPKLKRARAEVCAILVNDSMSEFEIDVTLLRQAAYLAQLAHESGELCYFEELSDGKQYEGRKDLGNLQPGDGPRYKGRGPIQLTGRANYRKVGTALGLNLEDDPTQASKPSVGFRVAGYFWKSHGLNELADAKEFEKITLRINGGLRGLDKRKAYYERAKEVLGA